MGHLPLAPFLMTMQTETMKTFALFLLCLCLSLPSWSQDEERLKEFTDLANNYGSHLAYAQACLLANKLDQPNHTQSYKLSRYSLLSDLYGGFSVGSDEFRGNLDLYTGKRAVDESLQLESIDALEDELKRRTVDIETIEPLQIRSHPWEEMVREVGVQREVPASMHLVPHDHLAVLFYDSVTIGEMEGAFKELASGADALFDLSQSLSIRAQVAQRLGIEEFQQFEALMGETVFVSEDLDFFPSTHYALIFKGDPASKLGANLLLKSPAKGRIGSHFVIASSQQLWDRIAAVEKGELASMADSLDFQYANAVLEQKRDGFVYLSEAFILKLVSPQHRINAARRLGAIERLVSRQYAVFAYRCLTDSWPGNFGQMVKEGYLRAAPEDDSFLIDQEGIVSHKIWGSLYQLKPLSEVHVNRVTPEEKELYERFSRGYQSFWRTFFDPIGVAFKVDHELNFHTIILPLIDNSEYRTLSALAGGEPITFDGIERPLLGGPISLSTRFNLGDLLLSFDGRRTSESDREERKQRINQRAQKELQLDPPVDLFQLMGDELSVTLHSDFDPSHQWNIDQVPVSLAFQLIDRESFRRTARAAMGKASHQAEPKSFEGVEYHVLPLFGQFKVYLLYHQDYLHLTFHLPTLERLCRATKEKTTPYRLTAKEFLGEKQNLLWRGDFEDLNQVRSYLSGVRNNRRAHEQMVDAAGYMQDVAFLDQALGRPGSSAKYLQSPPQRMYGVPLAVARGKVRYGGLALDEIDFEFRYHSQNEREDEGTKIDLEQLVKRYADGRSEEAMKTFRSLAVGLQFTPEGLSTRVALNNPNKSAPSTPAALPTNKPQKGWLMGLGAALISSVLILLTTVGPGQESKG